MSRVADAGWIAVALTAALMAVPGCAPSGERAEAPKETAIDVALVSDEWPAEELAPASPFEVGYVPDGYGVEVAGDGDTPAYLSSDSFGTVEPSILVVPPRWDPTSSNGIFRVSAVDYSGLQGQFHQASPSYTGSPTREFEVRGQLAHYNDGRHRSGAEIWPELLVDVREGWALRIAGPRATEEQLVDLAERASLDSANRPILESLPPGLAVVGRLSGEQVNATDGRVRRANTGASRVDITGYAVVYVWDGDPGEERGSDASYPAASPGDPGRLIVASVPGSSAHISAITWLRTEADQGRGGETVSVQRVAVRGEVGLLSRTGDRKLLVFTAPSGQLLIVSSEGDRVLEDEELVRIAESVSLVNKQRWDELVIELEGGPGLHPDPGRLELARGEIDGVEWLLQNSPVDHQFGIIHDAAPDQIGGERFPVPLSSNPDDCVKLSTGARVCLGGTTGMATHSIGFYDREADMGRTPGVTFEVGLVMPQVHTVRITTAERAMEVATAELLDTTVRLYVVAYRPGEEAPTCFARIEHCSERVYLDADGAPVSPA